MPPEDLPGWLSGPPIAPDWEAKIRRQTADPAIPLLRARFAEHGIALVNEGLFGDRRGPGRELQRGMVIGRVIEEAPA